MPDLPVDRRIRRWPSGQGTAAAPLTLNIPPESSELQNTSLPARFADHIDGLDLRVAPATGPGPAVLRVEVLAGLTVARLPEAVAFAFVAGVQPIVGLYAAFIVGLITAFIGRRPGMISGATGALAVVIVSLVAAFPPGIGVQYLFATVVLMGLIQGFVGLMRWGKFIRLVPHPILRGFVNGLAIVIARSQIDFFRSDTGAWLGPTQLAFKLALVVLTMAVIRGLPRLTTAIPAPLAGIAVTAAVVIGFGLPVPDVGDLASIAGGRPQSGLPDVPFDPDMLRVILP